MFDFALAGRLFWEFFKIGLFAVGGGPATLPYLIELGDKYGWFTMEELTSMIAVSQSTPGPLGLNMSTYVGYQTLGPWGGVIATFGLVTPSIFVICLIAAFFAKFNKNRHVVSAFSAIRPAVCAIIAVAVAGIWKVALFPAVNGTMVPSVKGLILAFVMLGAVQFKKVKKIHPVFFFVVGAIAGVIFKF